MNGNHLKFCSACASELEERIPAGDDRPRKVCTQCGHVHYRNPLVVVGCIVERDDEILLCRRAIEPAYGLWTTPAGFLELGEGTAAGARRETLEEAGADVEITAPHAHLDLPHLGQTYSLFRGRLRAPTVAAGVESLECAFVRLGAIPWDELAFPAVHIALQLLIEDREQSTPHFHSAILEWNRQGSGYDVSNYVLSDHIRSPLASDR